MANLSAVTFWLKDRQVNGVLAAVSGAEKLVKYSGRFYVVVGKDPGKRHYTQSSLPVMWKKILSGETPPAPARADAEPSLIDEVQEARATRTARRVKVQKEMSGQPSSPAVVKIAARLPAQKKDPVKPAASSPARAPGASKKKVKDKILGVPPVVPKQDTGGKPGKVPTSPALAVQAAIKFDCPYCRLTGEVALSAVKVGKAFFENCGGCGKEFGVRIIPTTVYRAEVAGFAKGKI